MKFARLARKYELPTTFLATRECSREFLARPTRPGGFVWIAPVIVLRLGRCDQGLRVLGLLITDGRLDAFFRLVDEWRLCGSLRHRRRIHAAELIEPSRGLTQQLARRASVLKDRIGVGKRPLLFVASSGGCRTERRDTRANTIGGLVPADINRSGENPDTKKPRKTLGSAGSVSLGSEPSLIPTGLSLSRQYQGNTHVAEILGTKAGHFSENAVGWLALLDCADPETIVEVSDALGQMGMIDGMPRPHDVF